MQELFCLHYPSSLFLNASLSSATRVRCFVRMIFSPTHTKVFTSFLPKINLKLISFLHQEKCVQYWPSPGTTTQSVYGDITVTFESEEHRDGYTVITLNISHKVIMMLVYHSNGFFLTHHNESFKKRVGEKFLIAPLKQSVLYYSTSS